MAFPPHTLVQFGGHLSTLSGPSEIWACGLRVYTGIPAGNYVANPQGYADAIAPKLKTWFTTLANGFPSTASLEWVKVNSISPTGHYVDATTHQTAITSANGGVSTGTNTVMPSFCSVALTLETGLTRGHAHRGRLYLPNYSYKATGAQISGSDATAVANAGKALLNVINTTSDGATLVRPIVASKFGVSNEVTGVSVDNIYDVQRRRKNRLTSTRTTLAWP